MGEVDDFHPRDFRRGLRGAGLTLTERMVAVELCEYAGVGKPVVWPAVDTLAENCGVSGRTVVRALNGLEAKAVIACASGRKGGRGRATKWELLVNGDSRVTLSDGKRVTSVTKRVTSVTEKGDTCVTRSSKEVDQEGDARTRATLSASSSPQETEPDRYCPAHMPHGTTLNCRACGTARAEHFAWTQAVEARRRERDEVIRRCRICDDRGYVGLRAGPFIICPHNPERIEELERHYGAA